MLRTLPRSKHAEPAPLLEILEESKAFLSRGIDSHERGLVNWFRGRTEVRPIIGQASLRIEERSWIKSRNSRKGKKVWFNFLGNEMCGLVNKANDNSTSIFVRKTGVNSVRTPGSMLGCVRLQARTKPKGNTMNV